MRTPRPSTPRRGGAATLIGTGTLPLAASDVVREGPMAPELGPLRQWPAWPDIRRASALRKCMIFPLPPGVPAAPAVSPAAMVPSPRPRAQRPDFPHAVQRRPAHDVRMLAAVSPEEIHRARRQALYVEAREKALGKGRPARPWYEDPIALGTLLILAPPIGLAALWSSKHYSSDARWALTLMTALTLCLGAVVIVVILALRS